MDEDVKRSAPRNDGRDDGLLPTGFWRWWVYLEIAIAVLLLVLLASSLSS